MSTVPPNELRNKRGNLSKAGLIVIVIGVFSFFAWFMWAALFR